MNRQIPVLVLILLALFMAITPAGCGPNIRPDDVPPAGASAVEQHEGFGEPKSGQAVSDKLDEEHPENMVRMRDGLHFTWTGLQLQDGLRETLQRLIFRAVFITDLYTFGDLAADVDFDDKISINGQELYFTKELRYFGGYDKCVEFIKGTYTGELVDMFLLDDRYVQVNGRFYSAHFLFGGASGDTGSYTAEVLQVEAQRIVIRFTVEHFVPDDPVYYDVSEMEFLFVDGQWLIASQGFEP